MRKKFTQIQFLLILSFLGTFFTSRLFALPTSDKLLLDKYINSLSSLIFYIEEKKTNIDRTQKKKEIITFTDEEIAFLWNKVMHEPSAFSIDSKNDFYSRKAHRAYLLAKGNTEKNLNLALDFLNKALDKAISNENEDIQIKAFSLLESPPDIGPNIRDNPYLCIEAIHAITPHLLPPRHPLRNKLDSIFSANRATADEKSFYQAGFRIVAEGPRSYIVVAKNKKLPGFLVKAYLDTELNKKQQKESWEWLVHRCEGANKIRDIIRNRKSVFFVVPDKWIYCLPPTPSPPLNEHYTRHLAILLATDMLLTNTKKNYKAWTHYITKQHLDELFEIIVRAKGASYRPDNIAYTKDNKFAFIDTEYPSKGPDFKSIRPFLNPEMLDYWDSLIRKGGP